MFVLLRLSYALVRDFTSLLLSTHSYCYHIECTHGASESNVWSRIWACLECSPCLFEVWKCLHVWYWYCMSFGQIFRLNSIVFRYKMSSRCHGHEVLVQRWCPSIKFEFFYVLRVRCHVDVMVMISLYQEMTYDAIKITQWVWTSWVIMSKVGSKSGMTSS